MTKRQKAIADLTEYIWSLKGKCDGIAEINKELINQYAIYAILANELSIKLEKSFDKMPVEEIEAKTKLHERLNKTVLNLYKTLKFEQIKDELADYGNPFIALSQEADADGDL